MDRSMPPDFLPIDKPSPWSEAQKEVINSIMALDQATWVDDGYDQSDTEDIASNYDDEDEGENEDMGIDDGKESQSNSEYIHSQTAASRKSLKEDYMAAQDRKEEEETEGG